MPKLREIHVSYHELFAQNEPEHLALVLDLDVPDNMRSMEQREVWEREQADLVMEVIDKLPQDVRFKVLRLLMERFAYDI